VLAAGFVVELQGEGLVDLVVVRVDVQGLRYYFSEDLPLPVLSLVMIVREPINNGIDKALQRLKGGLQQKQEKHLLVRLDEILQSIRERRQHADNSGEHVRKNLLLQRRKHSRLLRLEKDPNKHNEVAKGDKNTRAVHEEP